ncbi:MAG: F0F1 ATP synthase subunit epsilon [Candidatus Latescibacteria bacterium]|jgi:F-type H+-transporting ATPase subunit epsilon|nr:F0F1 ATP synthase subunit epsilon [Candidatus Latescibacterota bacterium]
MPVFNLDIVTPETTVYSGTVESLRAPGTEGGFGVLARHHPMLAGLTVGEVLYREEGGDPKRMATSGGFAEVRRDQVTLLVETAEHAAEIDVDRAEGARERAKERLVRQREADVDVARAEVALARAINRLRVAEMEG